MLYMGDRPFKLLMDSGLEQESPVVTLKLQYDETSTRSTINGSYLSDDTAYEITWCCTCTNQIDADYVGYAFTE